MYSNFCYSDNHLGLLGLKVLTDSMIRLADRADRPKLYRARREFFSLCDKVGYLFDKMECLKPLAAEEYYDKRKAGYFAFYLLEKVIGRWSTMRLMALSFKEVLENTREACDELNYQILMDDFIKAIDETSSVLAKLHAAMESYLDEIEPKTNVEF